MCSMDGLRSSSCCRVSWIARNDYQLTPQDMQKLAKADFMIVKVIGMEAFLGALVKQPNPNIHNIDGSPGI